MDTFQSNRVDQLVSKNTDLKGRKFFNSADPTNPQDVATKHYVDAQIALVPVDVDIEVEDNLIQLAYASGAITLSGVSTNVTGATLTLNNIGVYLVIGVFDFQCAGADLTPNTFIGKLFDGTTLTTNAAISTCAAAGERKTVSQQWIYNCVKSNTTLTLQVSKSGGTGTSTCNATHTSISAMWVTKL